MSCCTTGTPVLPTPFTEGDTESPIRVRWNTPITTQTSELVIQRPDPYSVLTIPGNLIEAASGIYEYPWSPGDLVAGEGQLCKARLITGSGGRQSTESFIINVQEDIA